MMKLKILNVVGARPNFMKIAPIMREMKLYPDKITPLLLHTGQHFDYEMSESFFENLNIPAPDFYLDAGSGSHAEQTANIMKRLEKVLLKVRPHLVLVVGDVNSTMASSLCAAKLQIPVAHVEAGLRSFDRSMPEEVNRVLTDTISDYLFITEKSARANLLKEGIHREKIYFVGNVMIDTLISNKETAEKSNILARLKLEKRRYAVLTLHRPGNVDTKETFLKILESICEVQKKICIVWPIHPRSKKMIHKFSLKRHLLKMQNFKPVPAMSYPDFLKLMANSKFILTDSGGIQEEATFLEIPCLTLRDNTERPVTVEKGTNIIVGLNRGRIIKESFNIISGAFKNSQRPELWDGKSARRIVKILIRELGKRYGMR